MLQTFGLGRYAPKQPIITTMVLLTMTPSIVEALQQSGAQKLTDKPPVEGEPSLESATVGNPISHGQIVDLWKALGGNNAAKYNLECLLKGSAVYIPPPPPKPEPSPEFKALMARLRREDEERKYQRMTSSTQLPSFAQQFPHSTSSVAQSFAEVNRPSSKADLGDDDVTFNDVHRQVMLLINFLVTIVGCAATLWIMARWWSTPARLFLTMGGTIAVAVAEVGLYYGYVWHLVEANKKEVKIKEVKQIVETWVVEQEKETVIGELDKGRDDQDGTAVRLRKVKGERKQDT